MIIIILIKQINSWLKDFMQFGWEDPKSDAKESKINIWYKINSEAYAMHVEYYNNMLIIKIYILTLLNLIFFNGLDMSYNIKVLGLNLVSSVILLFYFCKMWNKEG